MTNRRSTSAASGDKSGSTAESTGGSFLEKWTTPAFTVDAAGIVGWANDAATAAVANRSELRAFFADMDGSGLVGHRFTSTLTDREEWVVSPNLVLRQEYTPFPPSTGRAAGLVAWTDITADSSAKQDRERMRAALDCTMTAIMMVDTDRIITYANRAALDMMRKHTDIFRAAFPSLPLNSVVGTCIDTFHNGPAHQATLLVDPRQIPYETDLKVGPLTFRLHVAPVTDANGRSLGNIIEWHDITLLRAKECDAARLRSAVDSAMTSIMMVDRDLVIRYANESTVRLLRKHEETLRGMYPGFSADKIMGACIDAFHKHPGHQRRLLDDPRNLPYITTIKLGPLSFLFNVTANRDAMGNYVGNCLEWSDVTEQVDAQSQVQRLVDEAVAGRLDERVDSGRYEGFMRQLTEGINTLLDTVVAEVRETARVVGLLADGDLTELATGDFQGEFGALRDTVNESVKSLRDVVGEIRSSAAAVGKGATEIASGNNDLSARTQEQAASLEQTAASVEAITSTIKQNADNARQANQLAAAAREQAEKGGDVVSRAANAMAQINASSRKISDIIGVIDSIAFQTNILALNAAVEAARAGEQGRGFAVVAAEVRKLAQRSAEAAKEIKGLIGESVERVSDGTKLVDASGRTLEGIVTAVKKVGDIVAEIAATSQEQAAGIEHVNKAIAQMDEVTQQNAALVEEMAAASESLDGRALGLLEVMDTFRTHPDASSRDDGAGWRGGRETKRSPAKPAHSARRPS